MRCKSQWRVLVLLIPILLMGVMVSPSQTTLNVDVAVVGGGAGGVSAALQAARMGATVALVEETPWLGGMFTAAGISAFDGNNYAFNTGMFKEVRILIEDYYGGPANVHTGWVSLCSFEPHVAKDILHSLVAAEPNITLYLDAEFLEVLYSGNQINGVRIRSATDVVVTINAQVTIEATEYGDLLALAGVPFRVGREAQYETLEPQAPPVPDSIIQDFTFAALLKRYSGEDRTWASPPPGYDPMQFNCCCTGYCTGWARWSCAMMLSYGELPNDKYMINWPLHGNDFYIDMYSLSREQRAAALEQAKLHTLRFVYFHQDILGWTELDLADDEYPTADSLPFIPYVRESRRVIGASTFKVFDITNRYGTISGDVYKGSIAVGDYPIDHHHSAANAPPLPYPESYPTIPKIGVPYFALVPEEFEGLLVAEKSISVTHIVNGCTRLQPIVMLIGQAAGAAAALACQHTVEPRDVDIRELQQALLDAGSTCMPMDDVYHDRWSFQSIQRICLAGVLRVRDSGRDTDFDPLNTQTLVQTREALEIALQQSDLSSPNVDLYSEATLTRAQLAQLVYEFVPYSPPANTSPYFTDVPESHPNFNAIQAFHQHGLDVDWIAGDQFLPDEPVTREQFAVVVDRAFDPFNRYPVPLVPEPRETVQTVRKLPPRWKLHHLNTTEGWSGYPPSWFPQASEPNREMAFNLQTKHLLITDYANNAIHIVDAANGQDLGSLDNTPISGGVLSLASIDVDANGVIYAAPYADLGFRIYRWAHEGAPGEIAFEANLSVAAGRVLAVSGTGSNTLLFLSRGSDSGGFYVFDTTDGENFSLCEEVPGPGGFGPYGTYGLAVQSPNSVFFKGGTSELVRYVKPVGSWEHDTLFNTSEFYYGVTSKLRIVPEKGWLIALAVDPLGPILTDAGLLLDTGAAVFEISDDALSRPIAFAVLEEENANQNRGGGVAYDPQTQTLFASMPCNGFAAYDACPLYPTRTTHWHLYH